MVPPQSVRGTTVHTSADAPKHQSAIARTVAAALVAAVQAQPLHASQVDRGLCRVGLLPPAPATSASPDHQRCGGRAAMGGPGPRRESRQLALEAGRPRTRTQRLPLAAAHGWRGRDGGRRWRTKGCSYPTAMRRARAMAAPHRAQKERALSTLYHPLHYNATEWTAIHTVAVRSTRHDAYPAHSGRPLTASAWHSLRRHSQSSPSDGKMRVHRATTHDTCAWRSKPGQRWRSTTRSRQRVP